TFVIDAFSCSMPRTVLICASWLVTCALSSGLSGSWLRICATSSFRNRSSVPSTVSVPSAGAPEAAAADFAAASAAAARLAASFCVLPIIRVLLRSLAELQRLQRELLRRVHHFDVVLVRTRRRDHVDHLLDDVDVALRDVAVGIGQR